MLEASVVRSRVHDYVDALNRRDRAAFLALFSDAAEQYDPVGDPGRTGRGAIAGWWDGAVKDWEHFEITAREIYVADRFAALVWTIEERHAGKRRHFSGVDILRIDDDARIMSVHAYWERSALPAFE